MAHTHNRALLSHNKKDKILLFAEKWMDLKIAMLSKISQTERQMSHVDSKKDDRKEEGRL